MPLRFTIRDLLWLTVVVALVVGWWVHLRAMHRQFASEFNSMRDEERQLVSLYAERPRLESEVGRLERLKYSLNFNMRFAQFATQEYKDRLSKAETDSTNATSKLDANKQAIETVQAKFRERPAK